jgi:hypothetical protein
MSNQASNSADSLVLKMVKRQEQLLSRISKIEAAMEQPSPIVENSIAIVFGKSDKVTKVQQEILARSLYETLREVCEINDVAGLQITIRRQ